ncbi:unnamed protein product [Cyprideis torosa]|uniref:Uncharacterized protein n=1 Tax=Cyprideis torosa TaxID=163714 RepID=A0A7R8WRE9_9CRUS|nr:unnamed protein product [Cyprideis torosa]CAG0904086.1 unnamed protein product [Cyprideis torosa]
MTRMEDQTGTAAVQRKKSQLKQASERDENKTHLTDTLEELLLVTLQNSLALFTDLSCDGSSGARNGSHTCDVTHRGLLVLLVLAEGLPDQGNMGIFEDRLNLLPDLVQLGQQMSEQTEAVFLTSRRHISHT